MGNNVYQDTIDRELAKYGDQVKAEYEMGGKHPKVILRVGDKSRFLTFPASASDNVRGPLNMRSNLRAILADLGAVPEAQPQARIAVYVTGVMITIPRSSPLYKRFALPGKKPTAWWEVEAISNPDLKGDPFLSLKWCGNVHHKDPVRKPGVLRGSFNSLGDWQAAVVNSRLPAISRLGPFGSAPLRFMREEGERLLFRLPSAKERKPATPVKVLTSQPEPAKAPLAEIAHPPAKVLHPAPSAQVVKEEAPPAPARERSKSAAPSISLPLEQPVQLVFPKQTISLEQAVDIINRKKERMKDNLILSVDADGYLSAMAQLGGKK